MNENVDKEQPTTEAAPARALVPSTQRAARGFALLAIKTVIKPGTHLGVSTRWFAKQIDELGLSLAEAETLVLIRTEFKAGLPQAVKLLKQGITVEDLYGCYRTQRALRQAYDRADGEYDCSLTKIVRLISTFPEADATNDDLDNLIVDIHEAISKQLFWIKYADKSIEILCDIARHSGCAQVDTALALLDSRLLKDDGLIDEGEDDEIEVQRNDYDCRNDR